MVVEGVVKVMLVKSWADREREEKEEGRRRS